MNEQLLLWACWYRRKGVRSLVACAFSNRGNSSVNWKIFVLQISFYKLINFCRSGWATKNFHTKISYIRIHMAASCQKSIKEVAASKATMNIRCWLCFLPSLCWFTTAFSTALFARVIACIGRHIDNDPFGSGRPPDNHLAWRVVLTGHCKLWLAVKRDKSKAFKTAVFVCTSHVLFSYCKSTLWKMFREFNFLFQLDQWKCFTTKLLPIYCS